MPRFRSISPYLKPFFFATLFALAVRLFVLEDFRIASGSMIPTLREGDLVMVTKFDFNLRIPFSTYELLRFRDPRRGEVVAFTLPGKGGDTLVKRVIGLPGENLELKDGIVYIGGKAAQYRPVKGAKATVFWEEPPGSAPYPIERGSEKLASYGPIDIPAGYFFVLGDQRAQSVDSREWGPVPLPCLKGKVRLVWLSLDPAGGIESSRIGLWVK